MIILWYAHMLENKELVEFSLKMDMPLVMNPENLKNMRGIMPHMIWLLLP
jgi:hypothetical protein